MSTEDKQTQQTSLDKAIDILSLLGQEDNKTIRELSDELNLAKSTIHRVLQILERRGLVKKNRYSEKYKLGYKILEFSSRMKNQEEIRELAIEYMKQLSTITGDTVQLATLTPEQRVIIIETVEGTNDLRVFARPGQTYPLTYGNFGKVFLSSMTLAEIKKQLKEHPLKAYGSGSILDEERFIAEVDVVRQNHLAISSDDPIDGALTIAVPIVNSYNEMIAAISIAGVKTHYKMSHIEELKEAIKNFADKIMSEI